MLLERADSASECGDAMPLTLTIRYDFTVAAAVASAVAYLLSKHRNVLSTARAFLVAKLLPPPPPPPPQKRVNVAVVGIGGWTQGCAQVPLTVVLPV